MSTLKSWLPLILQLVALLILVAGVDYASATRIGYTIGFGLLLCALAWSLSSYGFTLRDKFKEELRTELIPLCMPLGLVLTKLETESMDPLHHYAAKGATGEELAVAFDAYTDANKAIEHFNAQLEMFLTLGVGEKDLTTYATERSVRLKALYKTALKARAKYQALCA